jgi:hypothetical protein
VDCTLEVRPGVALLSLNERVSNTKTVGQCAVACAQAPGCVAFSWNRVLQLCAVKKSLTGGTLPDRAVVSGIRGPCSGGPGGGGGGPGGPGASGPGMGGPGGPGGASGTAFAAGHR